MGEKVNPLNIVCSVIATSSLNKMQVLAVNTKTKLVELRLDYLENPSILNPSTLESIGNLVTKLEDAGKRVILTLRDKSEGGKYHGPNSVKERILIELARYRPSYIDIEARNPIINNIIDKLASTVRSGIIVSMHFLDKSLTLDAIKVLAREILSIGSRFNGRQVLAKIVYKCNSVYEELPAMQAVVEYKGRLISFAIGESCRISRLLAPFLGAPFTYAYHGSLRVAPGQFKVNEVFRLWRLMGIA